MDKIITELVGIDTSYTVMHTLQYDPPNSRELQQPVVAVGGSFATGPLVLRATTRWLHGLAQRYRCDT